MQEGSFKVHFGVYEVFYDSKENTEEVYVRVFPVLVSTQGLW